MTTLIAMVQTPRRTDSLSPVAIRLIMATRIDVVCRRRGVDPDAALAQRLGSKAAAGRARHLVEVVGAIWPEPFALSPPCCRNLSHDEALLGGLIEAAETGNRCRFDASSRDLLAEETRDGLWQTIRLVVGCEPSFDRLRTGGTGGSAD